MNKLTEKKRSYLYDNIKTLLIFGVVYSHFLRVSGHFEVESPARMIYVIFFSFMMQGFFFISGHFSQNVDKCRSKAAETFILPFFLFTVLFYIERLLLNGHAHLQFIYPTHAMWFLIAMFVYRFGIKTLDRIPFLLPLSGILYLTAGCIDILGPEFALQRTCSFLFFFMLGYFCKEEYIQKIRQIPKTVMLIPMALLLLQSRWFAGQSDYSMEVLLLKNDSVDIGLTPLEGMATRTVVGAVALLWLVIIINLMPDRELLGRRGTFSEIGRNTMTVYLLHIFVRYIMKWVGQNDLLPVEDGGYLYCLIILIIAAACIWLFSRPVVARAYDKTTEVLYRPFAAVFKGLKQGQRLYAKSLSGVIK